MALKDWKDESIKGDSKKLFINTHTLKRLIIEKEYWVDVAYLYKGKRRTISWRVSVENKRLGSFVTKAQSLRYAKEYMKKH